MSDILHVRYEALTFPNQKSDDLREKFIDAHHQPSPVSVRLNPRKHPKPLFPNANPVPWCADGLYLDARPIFAHDPLWHAGHYYVQEASSMMIGNMVAYAKEKYTRPIRVLDLSAAPGGKTTHIASVLSDDDCLIANEVINARANILLENVIKWGHANVWVTNLDPSQFQKAVGAFDIIVIDAPCSGSGLWRKDADALHDWNTNLVRLCSERQQRIISDILPCLSDDGYIIYSTCSYSAEENEHITEWMINEYNLSSIAIPTQFSQYTNQSTGIDGKPLGYRMLPWEIAGEGFYFAMLKNIASTTKDEHKRYKKTAPINKKSVIPVKLQDVVNDTMHYFEHNDQWHFIPKSLEAFMQMMLDHKIHFRKIGTTLGKFIKDSLIPDHGLAMSIHYQEYLPLLETSHEEALSFLRKDEISTYNKANGWYMVCHQGARLGFVKVIGNRINNYYPKEWRLKK